MGLTEGPGPGFGGCAGNGAGARVVESDTRVGYLRTVAPAARALFDADEPITVSCRKRKILCGVFKMSF